MIELQKQVVQWAQDRGLLTDVTPERIEKQTLKVLEEIGETAGAYLKGNQDELVDGIGDVAVTLIILAAMDGGCVISEVKHPCYQSDLISLCEDVCACRTLGYSGLVNAFNTLENFALINNYALEDCLQSAYDVISKRTGKMVNGTFVKDK